MISSILLDHLFVALLAIVALYAVFVGQPQMKRVEGGFDAATKIGAYWTNGVVLWVAAAMAGGVWLFAGRPIADLGLAWPAGRVAVGLLVAVLFTVAFALDQWWQIGSETRRARSLERMQRDVPFLPATRREFGHFTFLAVSAGVCEEILFRGYLISYISAFTGDTKAGLAAAVLVPGVAFGLVHLYQGWKAVAKIVFVAVTLGAIFLLTRSLLVPIVLHVTLDLVGGLTALGMRPPKPGQSSSDEK